MSTAAGAIHCERGITAGLAAGGDHRTAAGSRRGKYRWCASSDARRRLSAVLVELIEPDQHFARLAPVRRPEHPGLVQLVDDRAPPGRSRSSAAAAAARSSRPGSGCRPRPPRGTARRARPSPDPRGPPSPSASWARMTARMSSSGRSASSASLARRASRRAAYQSITRSVSSVAMYAPWSRIGSLLPGGRNSMSPLPSSASAPLPSRMVRLSTLRRHPERDPAREVRLDEAGDDVHRRALRREDEVDADGARLLRQHGERRLHLALHRHHQVGQLVHDRARSSGSTPSLYASAPAAPGGVSGASAAIVVSVGLGRERMPERLPVLAPCG